MVEDLGGPVWHVSARQITGDWGGSFALARHALRDVGDASRGEWEERTERTRILHLKRRLSASEDELVGPLRDIRGTDEERRRLHALVREAPAARPYALERLAELRSAH